MKQDRKLWFAVLVVTACLLILATAFASRTVAPSGVALAFVPDAKVDFNSKCASCHGKDGRAKSLHAKHEHARDLTDASWQSDVSDERLFNSISNGKGKMPAFKKKLSEDQIDALVKYVRQFKR
jgi:mono/diheme cytochrome c family protein